MHGYRPTANLQRFVSILSAIRHGYCVPARSGSALAIRNHRLEAIIVWKVITIAALESEYGVIICCPVLTLELRQGSFLYFRRQDDLMF